MKYERLTCSTT